MRRAQATVFVIIGLVLLLLVGLFLVMNKSTPEPVQQSGKFNTQPIVDYVRSCMQVTGKDTFMALGQQGGILDMSSMTQIPIAYDSEVLVSGPDSVPYWYSLDPCDDEAHGCLALRKPKLCIDDDECIVHAIDNDATDPSIEQQAEEEIERLLGTCLHDFASFENRFDIEPQADPDVDVLFTKDDVSISLKYPLIIKDLDSGETVDIDTFATTLDLDFEELYRLAHDIYQVERQRQFIEENFLHILGAYQGLEKPIPPFRDIEFSFTRRFWMRTAVQGTIESSILPFISMMQIKNAAEGYHPIIVDPDEYGNYSAYAEGFYRYMEVTLTEEDGTVPFYPDHAVSLFYPYTGMYLDINGREMLRGETFDTYIPLVGNIMPIIRYNFKYDVAFPVMVTISDPTAFNGDGYRFKFALEANILNNFPYNTSVNPVTFEETEVAGSMVDLNDPLHYIDNTVRVNVKDKHTGEQLDDVNIYYDCGIKFPIGRTERHGPDYYWEGQLPYCATGGIVRVEKQDYMFDGEEYDNTAPGTTKIFNFELWPVAHKKVTAYRIIPGNDTRQYLFSGYNNLTTFNGTQQGLVRIERVNTTPFQSPVPLVNYFIFGKEGAEAVYDMTQQLAVIDAMHDDGNITDAEYDDMVSRLDDYLNRTRMLESTKNLTLVPGEYEIDGLLLYQGKIMVNKSGHYPAQNFTAFPQGGMRLIKSEGLAWNIPENIVYDPDKDLVVYFLEQPLGTNWSAINDMEEIEDFQQPFLPHMTSPPGIWPTYEDLTP